MSRCQWLCVAVGTPRKTLGLILSLRLTQQQPESPVVSRLSVNPRSGQPIGQRSRASRGGWSRLGTLAHSDRGVHKATTEGNSSEDAIGPRAGVPVCMLASPVVGFTSLSVVYETGPPDQRPTAPHPTPAICLCNSTAHFGWLVGWLPLILASPCPALSDPVAPRDRRPNGVPVRKLGGKR